ncbi:MAG: FixH family protein [Spirosomataceae bacterium]
MKWRYNWGWNIVLLFSGFVIMISVMVGMSVSQKIDLISDDYYAMELVHQEKIDKIKRANGLPNGVTWKLNEQYLDVVFPENIQQNSIGGNVILYCPSDNRKDRSFPIQLGENHTLRIPKTDLEPGRYRLQVDWSVNEVTYWHEGVINIDG